MNKKMDTVYQRSQRQFCLLSIRDKIQLLRQNVLQHKMVDRNELTLAENAFLTQWKCNVKTAANRQIRPTRSTNQFVIIASVATLCIALAGIHLNGLIERITGVRCIMPNNYLIWEATRPESDCQFCSGIARPLILQNISRDDFYQYAYSARPIIIKNAATHWPARTQLTYHRLKELYHKYPDSLLNFEDDCQFLPFKSSFDSLSDFFQMSEDQVATGKPTWYVGFSNCQSNILAELRHLYPRPHFLPEDAEIPNTDYIFMGYDEGAVMHLDYIPRLMWQAQLQGNKTWQVSPTPECDTKCSSFQFYVEPGDAVLIDTRIWYHGTSVATGEFSITIQSEYG